MLLLHRKAIIKGFHRQKKRTELIPAVANSHPPPWKHTPLHTVATRNSTFHHALSLVAPAETVSVRQQKLSARFPSKQAGKVGHTGAPEHRITDTGLDGFFFFPLKS